MPRLTLNLRLAEKFPMGTALLTASLFRLKNFCFFVFFRLPFYSKQSQCVFFDLTGKLVSVPTESSA